MLTKNSKYYKAAVLFPLLLLLPGEHPEAQVNGVDLFHCQNHGTNCTIAIPDGVAGGGVIGPGAIVQSSINVPPNTCPLGIKDVNIIVNVSHAWVGDLAAGVKAPNGTFVSLLDRPGVPANLFGCPNDNISAIFDDQAGTPVETACNGSSPAIGGNVRPTSSLAPLNAASANGVWTLYLQDFALGDAGALQSWAVDFTCNTASPAQVNPVSIPVISWWGLASLAMLLAAAAGFSLHRKK